MSIITSSPTTATSPTSFFFPQSSSLASPRSPLPPSPIPKPAANTLFLYAPHPLQYPWMRPPAPIGLGEWMSVTEGDETVYAHVVKIVRHSRAEVVVRIRNPLVKEEESLLDVLVEKEFVKLSVWKKIWRKIRYPGLPRTFFVFPPLPIVHIVEHQEIE